MMIVLVSDMRNVESGEVDNVLLVYEYELP